MVDNVKMLDFESFFDEFSKDLGTVAEPIMDMSIYRDSFQCSCGKSHWFDESIDIICEGPMKVMVVCPNDAAFLTNLKIKTFMIFKFKGFESLAGTHLKSTEDFLLLQTICSFIRQR